VPASTTHNRLLITLTMIVLAWLTLLGVGACMIVTPGQPGGAARVAPLSGQAQLGPANLPTDVAVTASEFKFSPATLQVAAGRQLTLTLANEGTMEHDLTIDALGVKLVAKPGTLTKGEFTFDKPGTYDYYCSIPGHKEAGMRGSITVVGAPGAALSPPEGPAAQAAYPVDPRVHPQGTAAAQPTPAAKPVPDGTQALPAPQIAPPVNRSDPTTVKVDLESRKVTAMLADGVAYDYWTFNGTVPGPMIRVRQGDTVELTLTNAPDAGLTHSIDLHAVLGPGGGAKVMQVPPGESATFRFQALRPGVYIYHCATPMVAMHIASGMYGMIVVEPPQGLPPVDHEYYVMEGDMYVQGERGLQGLRQFDMTKLFAEQPDYVVFNGRVGGVSGDHALTSKVGDTVRVFFAVGGPNLSSSFHIIGEIFDRVYPEGSLANPLTDVQTTTVPAGGATMVEFTTRVPGTYTLVDHSIERMEKGAAGQLVVEGQDNPEIFQVVRPGSGGGGRALTRCRKGE
jgi:nitrite reductase (NO-forming)